VGIKEKNAALPASQKTRKFRNLIKENRKKNSKNKNAARGKNPTIHIHKYEKKYVALKKKLKKPRSQKAHTPV
jgi:hypothetical protein